jgi:hypothetical protein
MEMEFHKQENMKNRDLQTLSLFAILALLTVAFVLLSREVLYAPSSTDSVEATKGVVLPYVGR